MRFAENSDINAMFLELVQSLYLDWYSRQPPKKKTENEPNTRK